MSHIPFPGSTLSCARVWALLEKIDAAEAARSRSEGCEHCPGRLHSAKYPRKPHALAPGLRDDVRRFSFCCSECRLRKTPPSVRFFGSRYRVAPVFLAACLTVLSGSAPVETASRIWGIPAVTLRRWRRWWREGFPETAAWRLKRGELHVATASRTEPSIARRKVTSHVLRHACTLNILDATGDIRKVSLWLGHQSLQTTEMYLRTDPAEKLGTVSEWRSPGLGRGRFAGVKDGLMAILSNV